MAGLPRQMGRLAALPRAGLDGVFAALAGLLAIVGAAGAASAAPLDLADATPRPIEVRFEISPSGAPGRLDSAWSAVRAGLLESSPDPDRVRIRIPAAEMESHLRSTGTAVVPGSFSDFVWVLDRITGHVVTASLEGRIQEELGVGFLTTRIAIDIRIEMSTRDEGGYRKSRAPFGIETHDFCSPSKDADDCTAVQAHLFDPREGYVNAVGRIRAAAAMTEVHAFSPLGEVRFSEHPIDPPSGPSMTNRDPDALFSAPKAPPAGGEGGGWNDESAGLDGRRAMGQQG